MQILLQSVDARDAMGSLRPQAVGLSVQLDILVASALECWLSVGNHRGTCRRSALSRNKSTQLPNSRSDTCIRGNPCHVWDTSTEKQELKFKT